MKLAQLFTNLTFNPVVLTTVWVELVTDPKLFDIRHKVKTRDHKLIAAGTLFLGAFVGRAIMASIGVGGALGVGVGVRLLIMLSWAFVPAKGAKVTAKPENMPSTAVVKEV